MEHEDICSKCEAPLYVYPPQPIGGTLGAAGGKIPVSGTHGVARCTRAKCETWHRRFYAGPWEPV